MSQVQMPGKEKDTMSWGARSSWSASRGACCHQRRVKARDRSQAQGVHIGHLSQEDVTVGADGSSRQSNNTQCELQQRTHGLWTLSWGFAYGIALKKPHWFFTHVSVPRSQLRPWAFNLEMQVTDLHFSTLWEPLQRHWQRKCYLPLPPSVRPGVSEKPGMGQLVENPSCIKTQ